VSDTTQPLAPPQTQGIGLDEHTLREALAKRWLTLHYQPQLCLKTGQIIGLEALVRMQHPERGLIGPGQFIDLAERTGLIEPLTDWVLREACTQAHAWSYAGLQVGRTAINLSGHHLQRADAVRRIEAVLHDTGVDPQRIGIEITESVLMHDVQHVARVLTQLKALGIEIAIDDFGTGYSSLSYLRNLPIDVVKIDRSFVNDVTASPQSVSMTRAIIHMAHSLRLKVLAEGVETEGQLALLVENRCDTIQGFLFSPAVKADEIDVMAREGRCLAPGQIGRQCSPRTLLLVDDEGSIIASLRRLLRRDGYQIITANSGPEGLQRLAEYGVDVIVSDQRMPGMTGVEFLRRAYELYPDTVRIVLSGYTELQSITDAINEGAIYKFFTKPWDDEQLREHIAEAFRHKEMADDNRRLELQIKEANNDLADLNRRLQAALQAQREQIDRDEARLDMARDVLESLPVPVIGVDVEGVVAFVNQQAERLVAPAGELIGNDACDVLPEALRAAPENVATLIELGGQPYQLVWRPIANGNNERGRLLVLLPRA